MLTHEIFDENGRLVPFTEDDWKEEWLQKGDWEPSDETDNDDLPF